MSKTIAIFGAGTGLGASVAHRFGREGYKVALVARRQAPLDAVSADLAAKGIEAATFTADLTDTASILKLVDAIKARLGSIDVIEYAPISTAPFIAAMNLDASKLESIVKLYLMTPVELVRAVLPDMLTRGDGGILIGQGLSAVNPAPYISGVGPAMAAMRNYIYSLNGELADKGVYAGTLSVGASILGSAGHKALISGELGIKLPEGYVVPTVEADDLAEQYWQLFTKRDRVEAILPAPQQ